ncbi:uncharacterized protein [Musca autumnalis]|uniref:uncharacterized protein n=1 Tax=Musca autumnalis TaxID=221902 RepID=UPI003CE901FF
MLNATKCRLCLEHCTDRQQQRSLFNEDGSANYVYELIVKYFSPQFLDMVKVKHLTSICLKCWNHICEFNNFQRTIYDAHVRLTESDLNLKDEPEEFIARDNDAPNKPENFQTNHEVIAIKLESEEDTITTPNASENAGSNQASENETCKSVAIDVLSSVNANDLYMLAPNIENSNKEVFQRVFENCLENLQTQHGSPRRELDPDVQVVEEQPSCPIILVESNDLYEGDIVLDIIEDEEECGHDRCGDNLPTLNENHEFIATDKTQKVLENIQIDEENIEINFELVEDEEGNVTTNTPEPCGTQQETIGVGLTLDKVQNDNPKTLGNFETNNPQNDVECSQTDQELIEIKLELEESEDKTVIANSSGSPGNQQETTGVELTTDKVQNNNQKPLGNSESNDPQKGLEYSETDQELIEIKLELVDDEDENVIRNNSKPTGTQQETNRVKLKLDKVQNNNPKTLGNSESNNPQNDLEPIQTDQEFVEIKLELEEDVNVRGSNSKSSGTQQETTGIDLTLDKVQNDYPKTMENSESNNPQNDIECSQSDQEFVEIKLELEEDENETANTSEPSATQQETNGVDLTNGMDLTNGVDLTLDKVQNDNPKTLGNSESKNPQNAMEHSQTDQELIEIKMELEEDENVTANIPEPSAIQQETNGEDLTKEKEQNDNPKTLRNYESQREELESETAIEIEVPNEDLSDGDIVLDIYSEEEEENDINSIEEQLSLALEAIENKNTNTAGNSETQQFPCSVQFEQGNGENENVNPLKDSETQQEYFIIKMEQESDTETEAACKRLVTHESNEETAVNSVVKLEHEDEMEFVEEDNSSVMGKKLENLAPIVTHASRKRFRRLPLRSPKNQKQNRHNTTNSNDATRDLKILAPNVIKNRIFKKSTLGSMHHNMTQTHNNTKPIGESSLKPNLTNSNEGVLSNFSKVAPQSFNTADQSDANVSKVASEVQKMMPANITNSHKRVMKKFTVGSIQSAAQNLNSTHSNVTSKPENILGSNDTESVFLENATQTHSNADSNVATNVENILAPNLTNLSPVKKISRNLNTQDISDTSAANLRNVRNFQRLSLRSLKKITRHLNTHDSGDTFAANMSPHESTENTKTNDSSRTLSPNMKTQKSTENPNNVDSNATLAPNVTNQPILNTTQIANTANPNVTPNVSRVSAAGVINSSKRVKNMVTSESINDSKQSSNAADTNAAINVPMVLRVDIINKRIKKLLALKSVRNSLESDSKVEEKSSPSQGAKDIEISSLTTPSVPIKENSGLLAQISSNNAIYVSGSSGVPSEEEENPNSIMEKGKGEKRCWFTARKRNNDNINNANSKVVADDCTQQSEEESTEWSKGNSHSSRSSSSSCENISLANYKRRKICNESRKISKGKNRSETKRMIVETNNRNFQPLKTSPEIKPVEIIESQDDRVNDDFNFAELTNNHGNLIMKCVVGTQSLETSERSSIETPPINRNLEAFKESRNSKEIIGGFDNRVNARPYIQCHADEHNVQKQGHILDKTLLKKAFGIDVSDEEAEEDSDTSSVTEMSENLAQAMKSYIHKAKTAPNQLKITNSVPDTSTTQCLEKQPQPISIKRALEFDNKNSANGKNPGSTTNISDKEKNSNDNNSKPKRYRYRIKTVEEYDQFIAKWKPQLNCELCNVTCAKYTLLREHFAEQHPSEECYITCCQIQFRYRYEIVKHIYYHESRFKCQLCRVPFYRKDTLTQHLESLHSDCTKPKETYKCNKCGKSFAKLSNFKLHPEFCKGQPKHDNSKTRVACDICEKSYKDKSVLKRHKDTYHRDNDKRHQCHICDRIFANKPNLDDHLTRVHSMESRFKCKWCPKNFREPSGRLLHYKKVHTDLLKAERTNRHPCNMLTNMFQTTNCRLCIECCSDPQQQRSLFDEHGLKNEIYDLIVKYFSPQFLDWDNCKHLTCICLKCWTHISEFNNFQQTIYKAHVKLSDSTINIKAEPADPYPSITNIDIKSELEDQYPFVPTVKQEFIAIESNQNTLEYSQTNQESVRVKSEREEVENVNTSKHTFTINKKQAGIAITNYKNSLEESHLGWLGVKFETKQIENNNVKTLKDYETNQKTIGQKFQQEAENEKEQPCLGPLVIDESNHLSDGDIILDITEDEEESVYDISHDEEDFSYTANSAILNENMESTEEDIDVCSSGRDMMRETSSTEEVDENSNICHDNEKTIAKKKRPPDFSYRSNLKRLKTVEEFDNLISEWKPKLECVLCQEEYATFSLLLGHFEKEHNPEPCFIECCKIKLYRRHEIEQHIYYHQQKGAFKCDICCKCFTTRSYLRKHLSFDHLDASKEATFKCDKCNKMFTDISNLNKHKTYCLRNGKDFAEQNKSHKCMECDKTYKTRATLGKHRRRVHRTPTTTIAKERFKCNICDRDFFDRQALKDHMSVHTGEPAKACAFCTKTFITRVELYYHLNKFHYQEWQQKQREKIKQSKEKKLYKCSQCEKSYQSPLGLKEHELSHKGILKYPCKLCSKQFKYSSNRSAHFKRVHGKANEGKLQANCSSEEHVDSQKEN